MILPQLLNQPAPSPFEICKQLQYRSKNPYFLLAHYASTLQQVSKHICNLTWISLLIRITSQLQLSYPYQGSQSTPNISVFSRDDCYRSLWATDPVLCFPRVEVQYFRASSHAPTSISRRKVSGHNTTVPTVLVRIYR